MKEGIRARISRIISGSANLLVDKAESLADEVVLEEAIREVDSAIDEVIAERGRIQVQAYQANKRLEAVRTELGELVEKLEVAVRESMEEHARTVISRQMDLEAQVPVLEKSVSDSRDQEAELNSSVEALKAKKREMQEQLREYRRMKDHSAAVGSGEPEGIPLVPGSVEAERKAEKAATALNRVMERKTGLPSGLTHDVDEAKKLAELEEISRRNRIDERLQQARAHLDRPADTASVE